MMTRVGARHRRNQRPYEWSNRSRDAGADQISTARSGTGKLAIHVPAHCFDRRVDLVRDFDLTLVPQSAAVGRKRRKRRLQTMSKIGSPIARTRNFLLAGIEQSIDLVDKGAQPRPEP